MAAREAAAIPLPKEETTPPVTKINLVISYHQPFAHSSATDVCTQRNSLPSLPSSAGSGLLSFACEVEPRFDHGVRIQRQAADAFIHEPLCEVGMVGWSLSADADVFASLAAGLDREVQHLFDRRVALIEPFGDDARITIKR